MALSDKDIEQTLAETQRTLKMYESLEAEVGRLEAQKHELAKSIGAASFDHLLEASQKGLSEEALKKAEEEQKAFQEEVERDLRAAEEQFHQQRSSERTGSTRTRRMNRMV